MIPNKYHFVFGLKKQTEEFHIMFYLSLKSCLDVMNPHSINFWYDNEPYGKYWDKIKPYLNLKQIETPKEIYGKPIPHYAQAADIIRLQVLIEEGGIYADIDTMFIKPYPKEGFHKQFIMGHEAPNQLCNALMMSEKNAEFPKIWLSEFEHAFVGGNPGDLGWNTHSQILSTKLASQYPYLITTVDNMPFFSFDYHQNSGIKAIYDTDTKLDPNAFSLHLWENSAGMDRLNKLNEEYIKNVDTTYNKLARRFL